MLSILSKFSLFLKPIFAITASPRLLYLSSPKSPMATSDMINILTSLINPNSKIIEFGSGRSTLWFSNLCSHLIA